VTSSDWTAEAHGNGQYAEVNGINLYFETHGAGRPMILLHGGLGSGEMFGPTLPTLAERHQVIAVDLQGHGRTADIDRPLDVRLMADDIAALIDHLGLDKPDLVGYSLGGLLSFALMISAGALLLPRGIQPDLLGTVSLVAASPIGQLGLILALGAIGVSMGGAALLLARGPVAWGDREDARAAYRQAIAIKPDFAEAYSNLGLINRILARFCSNPISCPTFFFMV
jgi:pimeloyl-ACP methyl ester carboxylesterase